MKTSTAKIIWLLGPTSSGKTTLATHFVEKLRRRGIPVLHYDGDEVRNFFGSSLGFDAESRLRVVRTLVHLANKGVEAGINVVISALTANQDARDFVHAHLKYKHIVYIKCPIELCAKRDPKGLYKKALCGEVKTLIGVNGEYREPDSPDFILNTGENTLEESLDLLEEYWQECDSMNVEL
ncbi:putative adenylyl-sulfate kinase [Desulfomarina profundi]|uniref:Adenylyl-sulfate kinase n=1 Tax=Desulfomarina profundi TaxID=2772557 RepID=A0A8D5FSN6_9BACT|nr:adenylyl-sulfate kinase [Desulfomarina profundi]BCL60671.1 putative adenylyl-sulfate kinase [Desulfomarina profundi]